MFHFLDGFLSLSEFKNDRFVLDSWEISYSIVGSNLLKNEKYYLETDTDQRDNIMMYVSEVDETFGKDFVIWKISRILTLLIKGSEKYWKKARWSSFLCELQWKDILMNRSKGEDSGLITLLSCWNDLLKVNLYQ